MTEMTRNMISSVMIHPGLVLIAWGVVVMLLPKPLRRIACIIAPLTAGWVMLQISENSSLAYDLAPYIHLESIHVDSISMAFAVGVCIIAVISGIYGEGIQERCECGMSLIYAGSAAGIVLAGDCISLMFFLGISVSSSAYIVYAGRGRSSSGTSLRHFIVLALGYFLMLSGIIIYMFHYGNRIENIVLCSGEPCFWLIAAGIAVSVGTPPVHVWITDACQESSHAGSVYLSSLTGLAAVCLMIRMLAGFEPLIWIGAAASAYAVFMAMMQNDIRRLLAYNIVSQIGIITAATGTGNASCIDAAVSHTVIIMIIICVLMMCAGAVVYSTGAKDMTESRGVSGRIPLTAVCFMTVSLAIADMPGLPVHAAKILIMETLKDGGYEIPVMLITAAGIGTVLTITFKVNWFVFWGKCDDYERARILRKPTVTMNIAIIAGTALIILAALMPEQTGRYLPYTANAPDMGAVLQFLALIIGTAIPFFLFKRFIQPRDGLILDFDWFLRKPFRNFILALSSGLNKLFAWFDGIMNTNGIR